MNVSLSFFKAVSLAWLFGGAAILTTGISIAVADQSHEQVKVELSKKAQIKIEAAIQTASKEVPGTIIKAELEKEHGPLMWEFEIVTENSEIKEVHVDGESGKILALHSEKDAVEASDKSIHAGAGAPADKPAADSAEVNKSDEKPSAEKN